MISQNIENRLSARRRQGNVLALRMDTKLNFQHVISQNIENRFTAGRRQGNVLALRMDT